MTGSLQIKKGMYYAVINLYNNDGRRKPKWISTGISAIGNNKREANSALRKILDKYESGGVVGSESVLFSEYVKSWHDCIKNDVDLVTWEGYRSYVYVHVVPYFESRKLKLDTVTAKHIEDYYNLKLREGRCDGKGGLSPSTIRKHAVVIHSSLKAALNDNIIPYNPAERAKLPKGETKRVGKFYTIEQGKRLLSAAEDTSIETVIMLTLYYGFRRSEVCGLKWDAVDFDRDTISVRHTVVKVSSRIEKDRTKNKASYRTLPLLPNIKEYLLKLKERQDAEKSLMGDCYHHTDYICRWSDGRPLEPDFITRKFGKVLRDAKLPVIRFHDIRHPYVKHTLKKYCKYFMNKRGQILFETNRKVSDLFLCYAD